MNKAITIITALFIFSGVSFAGDGKKLCGAEGKPSPHFVINKDAALPLSKTNHIIVSPDGLQIFYRLCSKQPPELMKEACKNYCLEESDGNFDPYRICMDECLGVPVVNNKKPDHQHEWSDSKFWIKTCNSTLYSCSPDSPEGWYYQMATFCRECGAVKFILPVYE